MAPSTLDLQPICEQINSLAMCHSNVICFVTPSRPSVAVVPINAITTTTMKASVLFASLAGGINLAYAADVYSVQAQIQVITAYANLLSSDVQQVNGSVQGIPWALAVQQDAVNIYRQVLNGTAQANASPPFSDQGSYNVSIALLSTTQTVKASLASTQSKAAVFGELSPLVLGSLYQLKQSTDTFGKAIAAKLTTAYQNAAPGVIAQLDAAFNSAIVAYGGVAS
nr:hypothetical protein CFP56_56461 [Quercus suber]